MVNRNIQAKMLKKKRRGRYAVFSGSQAKRLRGETTKGVEYLEHEGDDKVRVKRTEVFVGVESFSKQVVNTGRGPNAERMQEYYNRVPKDSPRTLAEFFGLIKDKRYAQIWWETPVFNRISLVSDDTGRLDLFFHGRVWFFVELDLQKKLIRRSRDYGSRQFAYGRLMTNSIQWVEQIPM